MTWCAFHVSGTSELHVVNGTVNQKSYINILHHNQYSGREIKVMDLPARSPELNPIKQYETRCGCPSETWITFLPKLPNYERPYTWKMEVFVQSIARRMRAVVAARGVHTRYQLENRNRIFTIIVPEIISSLLTIACEISFDYLWKVSIKHFIKTTSFLFAHVWYNINTKRTERIMLTNLHCSPSNASQENKTVIGSNYDKFVS